MISSLLITALVTFVITVLVTRITAPFTFITAPLGARPYGVPHLRLLLLASSALGQGRLHGPR